MDFIILYFRKHLLLLFIVFLVVVLIIHKIIKAINTKNEKYVCQTKNNKIELNDYNRNVKSKKYKRTSNDEIIKLIEDYRKTEDEKK